MKKTVILCVAIVMFVLCVPVAMSAQDEAPNEKQEMNNGVVILAVQGVKKSFELQCNKGAIDRVHAPRSGRVRHGSTRTL